uniref:AF4/FMR2 family member 2-like isoform X6 n=1 Tax=Myxine glutinosa TaxID=7769 RepID=UPI0035901957
MNAYATCSKKDRQAQRIEEWRKRNQKFIGTNEPTSSSNSSLLSVNLFPAPYKINRGDEISSRLQNTLGRYDEMKDVLIHQCNQCYLVGVSHPPNHQAADQSIPAFPEKPSSSLRAPHSFRKGESFSEYDYSQVGEPCKISLESSTIQAATKRLCGQMFDSGKMGCGSIQDTGSKASRSLERSNIRRQHSSMGAAALPIWKPTAYVRPMDGQDLVTIEVTCRGENVSPGQLKPDQPESLLTRDVYSQGDNGNLTTLVRLHTDNVKSPQPEIGFFNTDCVENILREMTHSWPPLLAALPSASSSQSSKLSHSQLPTKENHLNSRHKRGGNLTKEPAWETDVDKSFLEDDLKLSSDEDEITQVLEQVSPFCSPFRHRARLQHFDESSSGEDHTCDISNAMSFELGSNMKPLHNSSGKTNPNWVHQSQSASRHIASDASTPIHDAAEASCSSGGGGSGDFAELTDLSVSGTSSDSHESDSESSSNSSGERNMNNTTRDNSPEPEPPSSTNKWQLKKWMIKVTPLEEGQGSPCKSLWDKDLCLVPSTIPGESLTVPTTLTTFTTSCISFEQTESDATNDHRRKVTSQTQSSDTLSPQRLVGWKQPKGYKIQGATVKSTSDEQKIQVITPTIGCLSSKFTKPQESYKQPHTSPHLSKQSRIFDHGKEQLWKDRKRDCSVFELQMPHVSHWNVPKSVGFVDFDSSEHSESGLDSDGDTMPTKPGVALTRNFTSNAEEEEMHSQRAMSLLSPLFPNSQLLSPIHEDTLPMVSPRRLQKAVGLHDSRTLLAWLSRTDMTDQNSSLPTHDQNVSIPKTTNDSESHWPLSKTWRAIKLEREPMTATKIVL